MARLNYIPLLALLTIISPLCPAQSQQNDSTGSLPNAKPVPGWKQSTPFSTDVAPLATSLTIEVRSPDQMTEKDKLAENDAESSISERAGFADLEFNSGKWSYEQLVCPDFPNHLLLRFTRNNGVGDQSVFSASVPLNGEGHVRIIPILRRSYTLFSPAPVNEITVAQFNHIRTEEKSSGEPSWVGTALCYAALAGANPVAVPADDTSGPSGFPRATAPLLEVPIDGGAVIHLADASAKPKPMVWTMTFNKKGRLLKVKRPPDDVVNPKSVPTAPAPVETPVPATIAAN
jgi:hypothetical protein